MPETKYPSETAKHGAGSSAQLLERPEATEGQMKVPAEAEPPVQETKRRTISPGKIVMGLVLLGLLTAGGVWGWRAWNYGKTHIATDDAFVSGNMVNVSPTISGTLNVLTVEEGTFVKKGQLIARLGDSSERASLLQAEAAYKAALSQIPQAEKSLAYEEKATEAAIRRAQTAIAMQRTKTSGAGQQVTWQTNTFRNQVEQADSMVKAAEAEVGQSQAQEQTAQASLDNARQGIETARRAARATEARIQAAQAEVDRAGQDESRYKSLLAQEAVSQQQYEAARAQLDKARAQLTTVKEETAQSQSQAEQAQKGVAQAESQVKAAQQSVLVARQKVDVARAGARLARANTTQVDIQQTNLQGSREQSGQMEADLSTALAGHEQVALRQKQIATAQAQAEQAKAALTNAQIALSDTFIYAPYDGTIVKKNVNVGASLSPGQTIVTMTQGDYVWVTANFKETQLRNVRAGQIAEVEVDSFPGRIFKGRVQSIYEATGAATSLLPPDNATGNFTKVVQRIPVRIQLISAGEEEDSKFARDKEIHNLRQGMSVTAHIDTATQADNVQIPESPVIHAATPAQNLKTVGQ